jgi:integrase
MLRPGELIEAEWSEINFETQTWEIEVRRMKVRTKIKLANNPKNNHIIPLSRQALAVFEELRQLSGNKKYVFQGIPHNRDNAMNRSTVNMALRRMGFKGQMTAHGFRGMASTMLNRMLGVDGKRRWDIDLIEQQLAHKDGSTRGDYNRPDSVDAIRQRGEMLQAWADYLDELRAGGQVIPFKAR